MKPEMLVRMANQMEDFFKSQAHDDAVAGIEEHIRKYWDPRMRKAMADHLASGAETGLKPLAREAAQRACVPAAGAR